MCYKRKYMHMANKLKVLLLLLGDLIVLYAALFLALALRYGPRFYEEFIAIHVTPFTIIFIPWILIFYIAGLYDLRRLRNNLEFLKTLSLALVTNGILAILLFYSIPAFGITPKTNLFIFILIFAILEIFWRRIFNRTVSAGDAPNKVLLIGNGTADEIAKTISENNQLGYVIQARMDDETVSRDPEALKKIAEEKRTNMIVVPHHLKQNRRLAAVLYELFGKRISVIDLANFYETIMRKVPLGDLEEIWFLENIEGATHFYDPLKRTGELIAAVALVIVLLPLEILIALLVKLTSRGSAIYQQTRIGQNGRPFTLYKFRTMRKDAEHDGEARWAATNDPRATPIGKLLRRTHLDELPQLINIINGELSFVGPRPERPEFVKTLEEKIPYYRARLLVKPGVTGWAQIHYRADKTLEDVTQKLQYDIYYLKNRSPILDLAIVLKTVKSIFVNPE